MDGFFSPTYFGVCKNLAVGEVIRSESASGGDISATGAVSRVFGDFLKLGCFFPWTISYRGVF